jgi:N-methylhydantoinase B
MIADRLEYVMDSGGPGQFRGGVGIRKDWRMLVPSYVGAHSNRHKIPGPGLKLGKAGTLTRITKDPDSDQPMNIPREITFLPVVPGDVISISAGGGGGYGDPRKRDPQKVLLDVMNGLVSKGAAMRDYGVVLDMTSNMVDVEATNNLRQKLIEKENDIWLVLGLV